MQSDALPEEAKFLFSSFYAKHKDDPTDKAISTEFVNAFFRRYMNVRINHESDRVFRSDLLGHVNRLERFLFWGTDEYDHLKEAAINLQSTVSVTQTGESSQTDNVTSEDKTVYGRVMNESVENNRSGNSDDTLTSEETNQGTVTEKVDTTVTNSGNQNDKKGGTVTTTTEGTRDTNTVGKNTENVEGKTDRTNNSASLQVSSDYPQSESEVPTEAGQEWALKYASVAQKGVENGTSSDTNSGKTTTDTTNDVTQTDNNTVTVQNATDDTTTISGNTVTDGTNERTDDLTRTGSGTKKTKFAEVGGASRDINDNSTTTRTGKNDGTKSITSNGTTETTNDSDEMSQLSRSLRVLKYLQQHEYPPIYEVIEKLSVCFMAILPERQEGYLDPDTNLLAKMEV